MGGCPSTAPTPPRYIAALLSRFLLRSSQRNMPPARSLPTLLLGTVGHTGCVACSAWVPMNKEYPQALGSAGKDIPVAQFHGTRDEIVRFTWGQHRSVPNLGRVKQSEGVLARLPPSSLHELPQTKGPQVVTWLRNQPARARHLKKSKALWERGASLESEGGPVR